MNKDGALIEAVQNGDVNKVNEIIAEHPQIINETNSRQETSILIATHNNDIEMAKVLIDAGADVNIQDTIQDSAYLFAGAQGRTEIVAYMLEHAEIDYDVYNRYGGNTIIPAAEKGHLDTLKVLLEDGTANIDHQNNFGYTALIEAVALTNGSDVYVQIVEELLKYGANKELKDNDNMTALDYAKQRGFDEMIALLQE